MTINFCLGQPQKQAPKERCATMQLLEKRFKNNNLLKIRMEQRRDEFNKAVESRFYNLRDNNKAADAILIPVVFHIVMANPSVVTVQQVLRQLDTLNKSFAGTNGDSVKIPAYFKPFFGKSKLQFCLAQRTPDGHSSTGIIRYVTNVSSFSVNDEVKHSADGGAEAWDTEKYFNVWICVLSDDILGYATFPNDDSPDEQGVVIDYSSLPGGSATRYNNGKTFVHEVGHYFNLYHIWGDDDGACSGTDYIDDTPNQANSTQGCYSGIKTDNCTTSGNGIMYQNYMDYSYDECMVMYTPLQVTRMEAAFSIYRPGLSSGNGCSPVALANLDASPVLIQQPAKRICNTTFSLEVAVKNQGSTTIRSLKLISKTDNSQPIVFTWTGNLTSLSSANITLSPITISEGLHTLIIYTSEPNESLDENNANDTLQYGFEYYAARSSALAEGFEGSAFPPEGWDIVNVDGSLTWQKTTVAKSGNASVFINNYNYENIAQKDYLRLPEFQYNNEDSSFLSFDLAAAVSSRLNTANNNWDTLEVLLSTDCGATYTSLYKKWGANLITINTNTANSFIPAARDWRRDSINLTPYLHYGRFMIAFANTTGWENNIYLDNINLRSVTINPNLKAKEFLVAPNPTNGIITVQFYPQPTTLRGIQIYNSTGQLLTQTVITGAQSRNYYRYDLSSYAAGIYIVRAVFDNEVKVRKIVKK